MSMVDKAKILDRVKKLIAQSTSNHEEEARTAAHMACKLINEHKLSLTFNGTEQHTVPRHKAPSPAQAQTPRPTQYPPDPDGFYGVPRYQHRRPEPNRPPEPPKQSEPPKPPEDWRSSGIYDFFDSGIGVGFDPSRFGDIFEKIYAASANKQKPWACTKCEKCGEVYQTSSTHDCLLDIEQEAVNYVDYQYRAMPMSLPCDKCGQEYRYLWHNAFKHRFLCPGCVNSKDNR